MSADPDPGLEELLQHLKETRGFDFTGYKRPSLARRIDRRMSDLGMDGYDGYVDRLQADPDEFTALFDTILINLTSFFRDPQVWEGIQDDVIPRLVSTKADSATIRVWCAGCATGEEAYTIAMLLASELGIEAFRVRVKIFATDVDEDALNTARHGWYPSKALQAVPDRYLESFFVAEADGARFTPELRRSVIFGRHDLVQDAPISRTDLVLCRNTLMYLNSETQSRVIESMSYSLNEGGFLVLGKAEMLMNRLRSFAPVDLKRRIFMKTDGVALPATTAMQPPTDAVPDEQGERLAFDLSPVAQLVIDLDGTLRLANRRARDLFGIRRQELGREFARFEVSYRPVELRSQIEQSTRTGRAMAIHGVASTTPDGQEVILDIEVIPLLRDGATIGTVVTFTDVTESHHLRADVERSNQDLQTAMEELQSTNEELETTNEELQSSNEELETTNEELQSTNEELETMNEELQVRTTQLAGANRLMDAVLGTMGAAIAVLGEDLRIRVWSRECEDLWGVRDTEAHGQRLRDIDIGLPAEPVEEAAAEALRTGDGSELIVDAHDRRGTAFRCNTSVSALRDAGGSDPNGVIVVMRREAARG